MTRIAHLSDLHLDAGLERRRRFETALQRVRQSSANLLVLTGDLTASGKLEEFKDLASALSPWVGRVAMVPGNHDLGDRSWSEVLGGPLLAFEGFSAPGFGTEFADLTIFPINTQYLNRSILFRALGQANEEQLSRLEVLANHCHRAIAVLMHHGPQWHPLQFFDGLTNRHRVHDILDRHSQVSILCGHDHRALDVGRVFAAASVADHDDPLRLYEVIGPHIVPIYKSADEGRYL